MRCEAACLRPQLAWLSALAARCSADCASAQESTGVPQEWEKWQRAASPARLPALPSARACGFCTALNRFVGLLSPCNVKTPISGVHLRLEPCSHRSRVHEQEPKPRRLSAFSAALRAARPQPPAVVLPSTRSAIEALASHVVLLSRRSLLITLGLPIPAAPWTNYRPRLQ